VVLVLRRRGGLRDPRRHAEPGAFLTLERITQYVEENHQGVSPETSPAPRPSLRTQLRADGMLGVGRPCGRGRPHSSMYLRGLLAPLSGQDLDIAPAVPYPDAPPMNTTAAKNTHMPLLRTQRWDDTCVRTSIPTLVPRHPR
jgi:hypothetical protein